MNTGECIFALFIATHAFRLKLRICLRRFVLRRFPQASEVLLSTNSSVTVRKDKVKKTMQVIIPTPSLVEQIVGRQKRTDGQSYRLMTYVVQQPVNGGVLL